MTVSESLDEIQFMSANNFITADSLSENAVYFYKIYASNSVGTISTNSTDICEFLSICTSPLQINVPPFFTDLDTTDVQAVEVVAIENADEIRIQCNFIIGSDARGCKVVLVGELSNATVNLTKKNNITVVTISYTLPHPLSCYHEVFAFDIEADGSTGTLPVPGVLVRELSTAVQCSSTDETQLTSEQLYYSTNICCFIVQTH